MKNIKKDFNLAALAMNRAAAALSRGAENPTPEALVLFFEHCADAQYYLNKARIATVEKLKTEEKIKND